MSEAIPLDDDDIEPPNTGRQIMADERRLLKEVRRRQFNRPDGCKIKLEAAAMQTGIDIRRAREIARCWANEDRYEYSSRVSIGRLTQKGIDENLS